MRTSEIAKGRICSVVMSCLLLVGCQDAFIRAIGKTHFSVGHGSSGSSCTYAFVSLPVAQEVNIVSDCPTQVLGSFETRRVSGAFVAPDGQQIPWACETEDARTISRITVNGVDYRFQEGNTFLISVKSGTVRVLQTQLADKRILIRDDLRGEVPEVANFFTQAAPDEPREDRVGPSSQ